MKESKSSSKVKKQPPPLWNAEKSAQLYGIQEWGVNYFNISEQGEVITIVESNGKHVSVPLIKIVEGMKERGLDMPTVLRI